MIVQYSLKFISKQSLQNELMNFSNIASKGMMEKLIMDWEKIPKMVPWLFKASFAYRL